MSSAREKIITNRRSRNIERERLRKIKQQSHIKKKQPPKQMNNNERLEEIIKATQTKQPKQTHTQSQHTKQMKEKQKREREKQLKETHLKETQLKETQLKEKQKREKQLKEKRREKQLKEKQLKEKQREKQKREKQLNEKQKREKQLREKQLREKHNKRETQTQKKQSKNERVKQTKEKQSLPINNTLDTLLNNICLKENGNKTILLTVGNLGYINLLVNWWLSVNKNTNLSKHSIIMTYDNILVNNLKTKLPFCNAVSIPYKNLSGERVTEKAVSFKKGGWDEITRFKLKAIYYLVKRGYTVYYIDPDVYLIKNSLKKLEKLISGETKVLIQQGKPYCSGVIYAPPNDITLKLFSPAEWSVCGTDDEHYIIRFFNNKYPKLRKHISVLDLDEFPNGIKWKSGYSPKRVTELIQHDKIELLHFNYISGIDNKIGRMREYGMWHKQMTIIGVPAEFQMNLNDICLRKNKSVYPPHQSGPQIEKYTHTFMKNHLKTNTISSNYDYLPIFWTALSVNGEKHLINKLKAWLKHFIKKHPNRKCWTVVQHCKGIQRTCGLVLPKSWIVFATSDPNAIRTNDNDLNRSPKVEQINYIPIHKRKVMHWHTTGFGRMTLQPPDKYRKSKPKKIPWQKVEPIDNKPSPLKESKHTKFYTKNHKTIPLLSSVHPEAKKANWYGKRRVMATFIGNLTVHPIRGLMNNTLGKRKRVIIENGKYKYNQNIRRFDELMLNSTFALCPRGYGNTSFRLVEALQFGTIPIYISDVFSLPFDDKIDWNKIAILVKPKDFPKLYSKLIEIESDQDRIDEYRSEIKNVYQEYFTMKGCCNNMIRCVSI